MLLLIAIIVTFFAIVIIYENYKTKKLLKKNIEYRKKYAESLGPTTRVIVNNGFYFFYKDDEQEFFGTCEDGKKYSFSGLCGITKWNEGISFCHENGRTFVGKKPGINNTVALDAYSANLIYWEMMPILRKNLYNKLDEYGIVPTHEYTTPEGEIFGCDINKRMFYCAYGDMKIHHFSELKKVTITHVSDYQLEIYLRHEDPDDDKYSEYTLIFDTEDALYRNILSMFKGILNRQ